MSRRVRLPAADDLFRPTPASEPTPVAVPERQAAKPARGMTAVPDQAEPATANTDGLASRRSSGRIRHDEKMTVYVTSEELLDLEHARLELRRALGVAVDRGRLVREAIALVLEDLDEHGSESVIVRRLSGR